MQILSSQKDSHGKLTITLEIAPEQAQSFLENEEDLARLLNEVGCLATAQILQDRADRPGTAGRPTVVGEPHWEGPRPELQVAGQRYYRKAAQKKSTKPPTEPSK